jgi:hypothetical protein
MLPSGLRFFEGETIYKGETICNANSVGIDDSVVIGDLPDLRCMCRAGDFQTLFL